MKRASYPSSIDELDFGHLKPLHPSPNDWRDHVIYFLLVDRFDNGKRLHAYSGKPRQAHADSVQGTGVHGGTLHGIKRRLKYLKGLGITTLWLSPILKNRVDPGGTLHGYSIQHFLAIDPRFGTKEDLRELVDAAHTLDMYVVLDIVINHTGDNWAYENDTHPVFSNDGTRYPFGYWRAKNAQKDFTPDDAVWPAELQSPDCYTRRGSITNWFDRDQAMYGDFFNLKDLDVSNPKVLETLIAIYKYWIVEADIDGYRVDTIKHVETHAAVKFFNQIKEFAESVGKQKFLLFGEIVDSDAVIASYVGYQDSESDRLQALDASLDFPLYFVLEEVIKGTKSPAELRTRYDRAKDAYDHSDGSGLVTFLDNHDQIARPYRRFLHDAADARLAVLGIGYILTAPGIPSIYYGTEQGFDGGGPPGDNQDNRIRECMFGGRWGAFGTTDQHFFNTKHPLYRKIGEIARIRAAESTLRYGRFYFREISEDGKNFFYPEQGIGFLAFSRILDNEEIVVVLNLRPTEYTNYIVVDHSVTPAGTLMNNLFDRAHSMLAIEREGRVAIMVTLPPYAIAIFKNSTVPAKK